MQDNMQCFIIGRPGLSYWIDDELDRVKPKKECFRRNILDKTNKIEEHSKQIRFMIFVSYQKITSHMDNYKSWNIWSKLWSYQVQRTVMKGLKQTEKISKL